MDRSGRHLRQCLIIVAFAGAAFACDAGGPGAPPPSSDALRFSTLDAGYYHTCALTVTGSAYCWGSNVFGTLGDGTRATRTAPAAVAGAHTFVTIDTGAGHSCALTATGTAWCWGQNDEGQVGDGTFTTRDRPVAVAGGIDFTSISAGHAHTCGVTDSGVAYCWGDDTNGQLGDGADTGVTRSATPVHVVFDGRFSRVIAGYYQTCGLADTGHAYCWGRGDSGQNGTGSAVDAHEPAAVAGGRTFTALAPGDRFVCGVSDSVTYCWGANRHGELGVTEDHSTVPVRRPGVPTVAVIYASMGTSTIPGAEAYACGIRSDAGALCWGGAIRGLRARTAEPQSLDAAIRFAALATGAEHVCGLSRDGYAYCGGANYGGQLGDDTRSDRGRLVPVAGPR